MDPHLPQLGESLKDTVRPTSEETVFTDLNLTRPLAQRKLIGEEKNMKIKAFEKVIGRKYRQVDVSSMALSSFGEDIQATGVHFGQWGHREGVILWGEEIICWFWLSSLNDFQSKDLKIVFSHQSMYYYFCVVVFQNLVRLLLISCKSVLVLIIGKGVHGGREARNDAGTCHSSIVCIHHLS